MARKKKQRADRRMFVTHDVAKKIGDLLGRFYPEHGVRIDGFTAPHADASGYEVFLVDRGDTTSVATVMVIKTPAAARGDIGVSLSDLPDNVVKAVGRALHIKFKKETPRRSRGKIERPEVRENPGADQNDALKRRCMRG